MRARALSQPKVIETLNNYFIPVYAGGVVWKERVSDEEVALKKRIRAEALRKKLPSGAVHVYLLEPEEGGVLNSMHVVKAADPGHLVPMLEETIRTLDVREGKPVLAPKAQLAPPPTQADDLLLHLTARLLPRDPDDLEDPEAKGVPAENWVVVPRDAWTKLLPQGEAAVGRTWQPEPAAMGRLLAWFYPRTESHMPDRNTIEEQEVKATVVSVSGGTARARLEGRFKMTQRNFFAKGVGENPVVASIVGYVDFDVQEPRIRTLRIVTEEATYDGRRMGVAVRTGEAPK